MFLIVVSYLFQLVCEVNFAVCIQELVHGRAHLLIPCPLEIELYLSLLDNSVCSGLISSDASTSMLMWLKVTGVKVLTLTFWQKNLQLITRTQSRPFALFTMRLQLESPTTWLQWENYLVKKEKGTLFSTFRKLKKACKPYRKFEGGIHCLALKQ